MDPSNLITAVQNTGAVAILSGFFAVVIVLSAVRAAKRKQSMDLKKREIQYKELALVRQVRIALLQDEVVRTAPFEIWGQINRILEDFIAAHGGATDEEILKHNAPSAPQPSQLPTQG